MTSNNVKMPSFKESARSGSWPQDVGIIAMEMYFPALYVDQKEMEIFDGCSEGKYTIGLGQKYMGFCNDREDIYSLCLTVMQNLFQRTGIDPKSIGYLGVGTETVIDKSKSIKSVLMQLFEESGNTDIEGIDSINACYGGTACLFNALAWIESSAWDGRNALIVAADIAIYAKGNARCTGGAGAIAMVISNNAPIVVERGIRSSHMQHVYDFYKPELLSEYPKVDGKLSIQCYLAALDKCYERCQQKARQKGLSEQFNVDSFDFLLFHSPYCKLVQKSLARLVFNDFRNETNASNRANKYPGLEQFWDLKREDTYINRELELAFLEYSKSMFATKTSPSLYMARELGNMYTSSLYGCLVAILSGYTASEMAGKRILMFSYGSGLASSMYSMRVTDNCSPDSSLDRLCKNMADVRLRLINRRKTTPAEYTETLTLREDTHHKAPRIPQDNTDDIVAGTWYLTEVDEMYRRKYAIKPHGSDSSEKQNSVAKETKIPAVADGVFVGGRKNGPVAS